MVSKVLLAQFPTAVKLIVAISELTNMVASPKVAVGHQLEQIVTLLGASTHRKLLMGILSPNLWRQAPDTPPNWT